jgi:ABC-2 type transport system permease protein
LLNLIRNENMKIYFRLRTWVLVGLLLLACVMTTVVMHKDAQSRSSQEWRAETQQEVESLQKQLKDDTSGTPAKYRNSLKSQLAVKQYQLDHNVPPTDAQMWGGVKRDAALVGLVTLLTVIVAADSVAAEFTWGTIKLLLIRPATRTKILLSKYAATLQFALFLLVVLFVGSVLINGIAYGFSGWSAPSLSAGADGTVYERLAALDMLAVYGLKAIELVMVVTLAFMISSVFRSAVLAVGLSIFLMLLSQPITYILLQWNWGKYFLFANTDLTQYLNGQPLAEGMTLGFSVAVLLVYFIVFNAFSWLVFTRRDVAA